MIKKSLVNGGIYHINGLETSILSKCQFSPNLSTDLMAFQWSVFLLLKVANVVKVYTEIQATTNYEVNFE